MKLVEQQNHSAKAQLLLQLYTSLHLIYIDGRNHESRRRRQEEDQPAAFGWILGAVAVESNRI